MRASVLAFVLATAAFAPAAHAGPTAPVTRTTTDRVTLAPEAARTLRASIAAARASDPAAFADVARLVARTPELDRKARGGKAAVALALAAMGPRAVMPLAELALDPPASLPREALVASKLDVVEALGILRDPRVAPVLVAWLEQGDDASARAAAEAVARLDTDEAADALVLALGKAGGERSLAVLDGMGMCHRAKVAKALSDRLASADESTARVIVKSLRRAASPWAWATLTRKDDESIVRDVATEALVGAFVRFDGETRSAAEKALVVVDDGRVARFVQTARERAPQDMKLALDGLGERLRVASARR